MAPRTTIFIADARSQHCGSGHSAWDAPGPRCPNNTGSGDPVGETSSTGSGPVGSTEDGDGGTSQGADSTGSADETDGGSDDSSGGAMPQGPCPNILSDLIDRHGEAQAIDYYQRRFGTETQEHPEPTERPASGEFVSPLSGQHFWELALGAQTTGASERNHTFFNADGSRALVRSSQPGMGTQLFLVGDLEQLPAASPTLEALPLDGSDPNVDDWSAVASERFWHPTDPDSFCWVEGFGMYCYDVVTHQSWQHTTFSQGPVAAVRDGSDVGGGRYIVHLPEVDQAFVYDIEADAVVSTDQTVGPGFGEEVVTGVDGVNDEPTFEFIKGGGDGIDYAHLTEDGRFTVWVNQAGGTELRDLSGNLLGIIAEDNNHIEGAWYRDAQGQSHHISVHVTGNANTLERTDVFSGWTNRLWAGVLHEAVAQPDGTWDFSREPILLADTTYGGDSFGFNNTVSTQFSAFGGNPYVMAGSGWVSGDLQPIFGVYSIMPALDASWGQDPVDIDRIAYSRLAETHVGTQAEPVAGPMNEDGTFVALIRTPWYGTNDVDNVIYATRIYPRVQPDWHQTVMQTGALPDDWSCN
ncbi:MAG: hypothetical protein K0V04_41465 [Deltaproteobacteria bacterium]|nr:hypothetical protein [Deltaproteobacteria bacterium]